MSAFANRRPFLAVVTVIILAGALILGMLTAFLAWGQTGTTTPKALIESSDYNAAGSYGLTGMPSLAVKVTTATPSFVSDAFNQNRGIVLLAYVQGAEADEQMLATFEQVKASYANQSAFFAFEAHDVSQVGDVLDQLHVTAPPILVVIRPDGSVYQLYTGWIGKQVMEQVVANAVRL